MELFQNFITFYDNFVIFQLTVVAKDNGEPQRSTVATILVTVVRNPNGPVFISSYYNRTIGEYTPIRNVVVDVTAEDADPADVSWSDHIIRL
jgi:hypothetical protein